MNSSRPLIPVQPAPLEHVLPNLSAALEGAGRVKIVSLGSSTTAGEGGIVAYPYRLEALLRGHYPKRMIDVFNRGISGEEAPKERDRINDEVIPEAPSLVIWQIGTNSVWQSPQDHPPSHDETIAALRDGIRRLQDVGTIDIILMDPQYAPAILTPAVIDATFKMVGSIAEVARESKTNLFKRFELMKKWHELAKISFDRLIDPGDDTRLHDSDWATEQLTIALCNVILARIPKPASVPGST
jgi:GDSL-like Lipase/Acylhydrolase family